MINRIILNETSYFGWGAREVLVSEIEKRHFNKVLVVTDKNLVNCGVADMVIKQLDGKVNYVIYDDVKPNPTITNCQNGVEFCKKENCDAIVAIGGGSVIDTAKCIGIIIKNPEFYDVNSLEGVADTKNPCLPIIALPTTAGTAAEVTINYVITDEKNVVKRVCVDPHDIPVLSIIDMELMAGMPKLTAASTGLDALTHAMEGYITKAHWEMTDMFHLKSMGMTYKNLEAAVNKDKEAMINMGISQYIAGMGFSNVGLGIVHSMAHQLGATYDVPHGIACALFLPYVLKWNGEVAKDRYREMAKVFDLDVNGKTDEECVDIVVEAIRSLETKLGVPQHLSEVGVNKEDFDILATKAVNDPCTGGNPREVTKEDIISLLNEAY